MNEPMKAYVINLPRSADRRKHMQEQLPALTLPYEITPAVDARDLCLEDPNLVDPSILQEAWFAPGVVGCALSHVRVYRRVVQAGSRVALLLEDDVLLSDGLEYLSNTIATHMTGAEVVLLNFHTVTPCRLRTIDSIRISDSGKILAFPLDVGQLTSAGAYLITREACARLASIAPPVRARADDWGVFCKIGAIDRVRCVVPLPVQKADFQSTMGYHPERSLHATLQKIARCRVPLLHGVLAFRRQLIQRRWSRIELVDE